MGLKGRREKEKENQKYKLKGKTWRKVLRKTIMKSYKGRVRDNSKGWQFKIAR